MKNKKGFTIIELLTVILIISILLIIAVPTVMKYMKKGTNSYYKSLENELRVAGGEYVETYRTLLPQNVGHVRVIDLEELESNKYIDSVKDEKGNSCIGQVTIEKTKTDSYAYYSCIKCSDYYTSKGKYCVYNDALGKFENSELDNIYTDSGDYEIRVENDSYEVEQGGEFIPPLAQVYYKGELIKNDLEGIPNKIQTNTLGTFDVVYYYHGAKKIVKVKVIDAVVPSKTQIVLKYNNKNGKSYKGDWYSGNIYVQYKSTDYTKEGIKGSGIDYYEVSTDGVNFIKVLDDDQTKYTPISKSEQTMTIEGNYVRYVRAVDKNGNKGPINNYRIKIDKTVPTCTWSGESTAWQPNMNLPANQRVTSRTIIATCSDSVSECSNDTKTKTWVETKTAKTKTLAYTMKDLAGNSKVCSKVVNIYLDKQTPTISTTDLAMGAQDYTFTSNARGNIRTTCGPSGCTVTCNPAQSRKTGVYRVTCTIRSTVGLQASDSFLAKHQYQVGPTSITDATWCGQHDCDCKHEKWGCGDIVHGTNCSCPGGGDNSSCGGSCWTYTGWSDTCSGTRCYSKCANTCNVYDCTDEAVHDNGAKRSTTDSWCYYR